MISEADMWLAEPPTHSIAAADQLTGSKPVGSSKSQTLEQTAMSCVESEIAQYANRKRLRVRRHAAPGYQLVECGACDARVQFKPLLIERILRCPSCGTINVLEPQLRVRKRRKKANG